MQVKTGRVDLMANILIVEDENKYAKHHMRIYAQRRTYLFYCRRRGVCMLRICRRINAVGRCRWKACNHAEIADELRYPGTHYTVHSMRI